MATLRQAMIDDLGVNTIEGSDDITFDGSIQGKKAGVFAYLSSASVNTITTGDAFQKVVGTFTNDPVELFSLATDKLQYDGTMTQYFEIDWHATFQCDSSATIHFGISKNSEVLSTTDQDKVMGVFIKQANEEVHLSGSRVLSLATNDTIQIQLTANLTDDVVTVSHFVTSMSTFFK